MIPAADSFDVIRERQKQIRAAALVAEVEVAEGAVLTEICAAHGVARGYADSDSALRARFMAFVDGVPGARD